MYMSHTTAARSAIALGLGLTLSLCGLPSPATALAQTGSVTITQRHNQGASYDAFMLFAADISDDDKATHVDWASTSMRTVVLSYLDAHGYTDWLAERHPGSGQHDRPQNAAEYIATMIEGSATDSGAATVPRTTEARTFATELARALASDNASPRQTATSGTAFTGPEGYYLFVTTDTTTEAHGEAGTAPIWLPLGGSVKQIDEKSSVPTVDKEVKEDATNAWGKVADANTGQLLSYRLRGTLPDNFDAFTTYHYKFTDSLEQGLAISMPAGKSIKDAITIKVDGKVASVDGSSLKASYENNVLTVEFADLKADAWSAFGIGKDTVITVEYQTHMNERRAIGAAGNRNGVYLTYTDDPVSDGDGRTKEVDVRVFAYKLSLHKVDEQTNEPIVGAGFTIRVADDSSDTASRGLYVQEDGSLASNAYEFATDGEGAFEVQGIDEGTYLISEVSVPEGWEAIDEDIRVTVSSTLDGPSLSLASLTATLEGGDAVDVNAASVTGVSVKDGSAGVITINATDDRWLAMPLTGMAGTGPISMIGGGIAVGSGLILALRKRRNS